MLYRMKTNEEKSCFYSCRQLLLMSVVMLQFHLNTFNNIPIIVQAATYYLYLFNFYKNVRKRLVRVHDTRVKYVTFQYLVCKANKYSYKKYERLTNHYMRKTE